jgi:hypothetical protein
MTRPTDTPGALDLPRGLDSAPPGRCMEGVSGHRPAHSKPEVGCAPGIGRPTARDGCACWRFTTRNGVPGPGPRSQGDRHGGGQHIVRADSLRAAMAYRLVQRHGTRLRCEDARPSWCRHEPSSCEACRCARTVCAEAGLPVASALLMSRSAIAKSGLMEIDCLSRSGLPARRTVPSAVLSHDGSLSWTTRASR